MTLPDGERWALPALTLADRCDFTCNAPAALRVVFHSGDLYACAHHFEAHRLRLYELAVYVQDERITTKPNVDTLEDLGRMNMRRGLTHADPCRWCCERLINVRFDDQHHSTWRDYFVCETCDATAADMESLKGLTFDD